MEVVKSSTVNGHTVEILKIKDSFGFTNMATINGKVLCATGTRSMIRSHMVSEIEMYANNYARNLGEFGLSRWYLDDISNWVLC